MAVINLEKKRSPQILWKWGLRLSSLAVFATLWEILGRNLQSLLMPTFFETVEALGELLLTKELWQALWVSNQAMLIGFAASVVIGIPLGLLIGRWKQAEKFVDPYLSIMLVTPMAALIPLFIVAIGLGLFSRVLVVFVFAFVYMTVNTRTGLRTVDADLIEMARSFSATERQLWWKILLPAALPALMTGVRIGLGRAINGMVIVELLLVAVGIGRLILDFQGDFEAGLVYAVVFIVVLEALILMDLAKRLEKRLIPWDDEVVVE